MGDRGIPQQGITQDFFEQSLDIMDPAPLRLQQSGELVMLKLHLSQIGNILEKHEIQILGRQRFQFASGTMQQRIVELADL